tara:strand:+ start:146 stop:538 length:393 start_codon:yes stop_codon:yes gene_type:complete
MSNCNQAILIGRLTKDPEFRLTPSGIPVCRFTIAINRYRKNQDEKTADFIRIVAWRRLAEICNEYLKKGKLIAIEGRLQIDKYEKDGQTKSFSEVHADNMQMLDRGITGPEASNFDSESSSAAHDFVAAP